MLCENVLNVLLPRNPRYKQLNFNKKKNNLFLPNLSKRLLIILTLDISFRIRLIVKLKM